MKLNFLVFLIFILFTLVWYQVTSHNRSFGSCRRCQCLSYRYLDKYGTRRGEEGKTKGISRLSGYNAGKNWDVVFCWCFYSLHLEESTSAKPGFGIFLSGAMETCKPPSRLKNSQRWHSLSYLIYFHMAWPLSELPNEIYLQNTCRRAKPLLLYDLETISNFAFSLCYQKWSLIFHLKWAAHRLTLKCLGSIWGNFVCSCQWIKL